MAMEQSLRTGAATASPSERRPKMGVIRTMTQSSQETSDDFRYGQVVIAIGRWFLLGLGMFVTLYRPHADNISTLALGAGLIWGLTLFNAYLHARVMMNRPVGKGLVYAASIMDIAVISGLISLFGGFHAYSFIFYYPAILAFSLVFPPAISFSFTGVVIFVYSLISFVVGDGLSIKTGEEERVLIARLVVMLAVAAIGTFFWRVERQRRKAAVETQVDTRMDEFRRSLGVTSPVQTAAPASSARDASR